MNPIRKMLEPARAVDSADSARANADVLVSLRSDLKATLRMVGLRPTQQRLALGCILFGKGDRHLTAEILFEEAREINMQVSLATIYNTLHQFTNAGLLRQVSVDGARTYFDTNVSAHHHFLIENKNELVDIPHGDVIVSESPTPPNGYEVARVEILVRLCKRR